MHSGLMFGGVAASLLLAIIFGGSYFSAHKALNDPKCPSGPGGAKLWLTILLICFILATVGAVGIAGLIVHAMMKGHASASAASAGLDLSSLTPPEMNMPMQMPAS